MGAKYNRVPSPPKTGWPPGLLQDDSRQLSLWFASRIDARETIRNVFRKKPMNKLTKVYTEYCGPCKVMTEILKDIDLQGEFNTTLDEIDAALDKEILIKHQIRGVPFFILEDSEGNVLRTQRGSMTMEETKKFLAGA